MKKLFLAALVCLSGCASKQRYVEGVHLSLGAYVPWEDGLYGVELVQYVSGAYFSAATNTPCQFTRDYAVTNSWLWGAVETVESSRTRLEVKSR